MKIDHEFTVSVPRQRAWEILTDIPTIAPCMPGAQLTGADGDAYTGKVKIKVGPVTTEYAGTANFVEKDAGDLSRRHQRQGHADSRGGGNASATITAQLKDEGEHTVVSVVTDLKITGKVAQFGNAMIAEVSEKLLGQFVDCLEKTLVAQQGEEAAPSGAAPRRKATSAQAGGRPEANAEAPEKQVVQLRPSPEPEAIDLVELAGGSVAKRLIPALIAARRSRSGHLSPCPLAGAWHAQCGGHLTSPSWPWRSGCA